MMTEEGRPSASEAVELTALRALGLGFDLTNDFRLRFAKGHRRLVELDDTRTRDVLLPGAANVSIPAGVGCDKGDRVRFRSDVLEFNQMSELINQRSSIQGKVPSGYFNALFDLTGVWLDDAKNTKHLAFDGYFISLYNLHLRSSPLLLREEVRKSVPSNWEPLLLSKFIRTYGTHIIVEVAVGGQDVICVKQSHSSTISTMDLKVHLEDLGDILFSDHGKNFSPLHRTGREGKNKVPDVFFKILQSNNVPLASHSETSSKDGITVVCSKRGGNSYLSNHSKWLQTVPANPDAILFKFVPITSLLSGVPGSGYLSHAINLYLRYKPDLDDLQYFLEFQVPRQWAPMFNDLTLGPQSRKASYPYLQFRFLGPKLCVNTTQVTSGQNPIVGLRLFLEGRKCNRLAIHLQRLSTLPSMFAASTSSLSLWQGSEDSDPKFLEPIQWKRYTRVCTSSVKYNPDWFHKVSSVGVFVVTGAQLIVKGNWGRKALHLRLHFAHVPNCTIFRTEWAGPPAATSHKGSFLTNLSTTFTQRDNPKPEPAVILNSGVYPDGPPVPVQSRKLLKFVDMAEVAKGPQDVPGHWLVVGARLVKESGKIGLHVKFALLNYLNSQGR